MSASRLPDESTIFPLLRILTRWQNKVHNFRAVIATAHWRYVMLDDNYTKKYPDIEELRRLLLVLKNNKDHIPVSVLKSKYKKGYNDLCDKIRCSASAYALDASLHGLKVHFSYADEIATIVTNVIEGSGIMHQFSTAIYKNQDLDQFVKLTEKLREMIRTSLSVYLDAGIVVDTSHNSNAA